MSVLVCSEGTEIENLKMNNNASFQPGAAIVAGHRSSHHPGNTLVAFLKKQFGFGLVLAATAGLVAPVSAADLKYQPTEKKSAPSTLTGRIVFVDKTLHALAVEIRGKILQINVNSTLKIINAGKVLGFDDLVAGQEVTLTFRENPSGRLEVVSVSVQGSSATAESAGSSAPWSSSSPFSTPPNPANSGGQIRSPSR